MKYVKKCAVLLFGVFLLAFAGQTKAEAAQALAPFTADQLMAADAFETIATEFIEVHKELQELKAKL